MPTYRVPSPCPHHCPPGGGGGRGGVVGLVVVAVIVAVCARSAEHAVTDLVEIVAAVVAGLVVVAVVAGVVVWRVRRSRAAAVRAARPVVLSAVCEPAGLDGHQAPAAIEARRTGVSAYPRIDAQPDVVTSHDCPYPNCHHNHPELLPYWQRGREDGGRNG